MIISHNMSAQNAQGKYKIVTGEKQKTVEKLASGYRINRGSDDAAGLSISEKMRFQIRGLSKAAGNIQDGNSLVNVADGALAETHSILQRQRELIVQAANDTNTETDRLAIQSELEATTKELNRIFDTTEFNTLKVFKGKDEIISGPDVTTDTKINVTDLGKTVTGPVNSVVWLKKGETVNSPVKDATINNINITSAVTNEVKEEVKNTDEYGHSTYAIEDITYNIERADATSTTVVTEYTKINDADYTTLKKPSDMVGSNGYINVQTLKGNMSLSCAMSQLGIKIDGTLKSISIYGQSSSTVSEGGGNIAKTTFNLGNGLSITQKIERTDNAYKITYSAQNTSATSHNLDVRLAFDTMNTKSAIPAGSGYTDSSPIVIANDDAKVTVTTTGSTKRVLDDIGNLYGNWEDSSYKDTNKFTHTGVGTWWEGNSLAPGEEKEIGSLTYAYELLVEPYNKAVTTEVQAVQTDTIVKTTTSTEYKPEYLDIQSGSLAFQNIPIRLWNLTDEYIHVRVPDEISAFMADASLVNIDKGIDKISLIRSYYGAMSNRLDHAYDVDVNTAENTQAAESRIRDADMSKLMVDFSKHNILAQAGESMMAQANSSPESVLSLLQ